MTWERCSSRSHSLVGLMISASRRDSVAIALVFRVAFPRSAQSVAGFRFVKTSVRVRAVGRSAILAGGASIHDLGTPGLALRFTERVFHPNAERHDPIAPAHRTARDRPCIVPKHAGKACRHGTRPGHDFLRIAHSASFARRRWARFRHVALQYSRSLPLPANGR